jgi:hypothetical protein
MMRETEPALVSLSSRRGKTQGVYFNQALRRTNVAAHWIYHHMFAHSYLTVG